MQERAKTVQVRVRPNRIVEGRAPGTVFWTTPARARLLLDQESVELLSAPSAPAPEEVKPAGPAEGKSSGAPSNGPSIGSASSSQSGKAISSSASEEDQASHATTLSESELSVTLAPVPVVHDGKFGSSQSTTPTGSRRGQTSSTSRTPSGGNGTARTRRSRSSRA